MPHELTELRHLVERYAARLTHYARRFCREPEDAAQLALAKLALMPSAPDDPAAWLYAACRREALQLARAERRRKTREAKAAAWFVPAVWCAVDAEAVQHACERLPNDEAEPVTLHM